MAILTGVTNKRFDAASLAALLVKIKASHDAIMGSLNPEQYTLTSDTELVNDKTYYTEVDGIYTAVEIPSVDDIASYYEVSVPAESRSYTSLIELERAIKEVAAGNAELEEVIANLDSTATATAGEFITGITITDGKITATTSEGLTSSDNTITVDEYNLSVNIDNVTLQKDTTSGEISVVKNAIVKLVELNADELTALGENNVQTAYKLIAVGDDDDRTMLGDLIKVAKDSSVKGVHIGVEAEGEDPQKLYLTYILADGSESEVAVDFSSFIAEAEMGDGMIVVDHKITIKLDADSEAFLTVSEDGLKLDGVQVAIDTAKAEAIATVLGEVNAAQYVLTTDTELVNDKTYYTEVDGIYTAVETPSVDDIASYYEVSVPAETREYNTLIELERGLKDFYAEAGESFNQIEEQVEANGQAIGEIIDTANNASFTDPTQTTVDTTYTVKFVGEEAVNEILSIINDVKKSANTDLESYKTEVNTQFEAINSGISSLNDVVEAMNEDVNDLAETSEAHTTAIANLEAAVPAAKAEAIATVLGETNTDETREYNTLIEAERAIETLKAEKDALQAEYDQFKQDVIDTFGYSMDANDIDTAWEDAGL